MIPKRFCQHRGMIPNWDEELLEELRTCESEKPILSCFDFIGRSFCMLLLSLIFHSFLDVLYCKRRDVVCHHRKNWRKIDLL